MKLGDSLDVTDLELLVLLQERPVANFTALAKLLNLSSPTVKRRLDRLYSGIIERVVAIPDYSKLGLVPISTFIRTKRGGELKRSLDKHPYLYFHVSVLGDLNGVHSTFRLPPNAKGYLIELLESLKGKLLEDYFVIEHDSDVGIRSTPRFSAYNSKSNTWEFYWEKWISTQSKQIDAIDKKEDSRVILKELEYVDLEILSQLTRNSRKKNVEILESLSEELSPQRLSDKLKEIRRKCISGYRVYLNWSVFDFNDVLFRCEASPTATRQFRELLMSIPPPFSSTFREYHSNGKSGFLYYLSCPPSHVIGAYEALSGICDDLRYYLLNTRTYHRESLNLKAFDPKNVQWIVDRDSLVYSLLD